MPTRIFAITAARETVTLDNEGRAEVSFTASNTGPKSIAGRAKLISTRFDQRSMAKSRGRV